MECKFFHHPTKKLVSDFEFNSNVNAVNKGEKKSVSNKNVTNSQKIQQTQNIFFI